MMKATVQYIQICSETSALPKVPNDFGNSQCRWHCWRYQTRMRCPRVSLAVLMYVISKWKELPLAFCSECINVTHHRHVFIKSRIDTMIILQEHPHYLGRLSAWSVFENIAANIKFPIVPRDFPTGVLCNWWIIQERICWRSAASCIGDASHADWSEGAGDRICCTDEYVHRNYSCVALTFESSTDHHLVLASEIHLRIV